MKYIKCLNRLTLIILEATMSSVKVADSVKKNRNYFIKRGGAQTKTKFDPIVFSFAAITFLKATTFIVKLVTLAPLNWAIKTYEDISIFKHLHLKKLK
jgi:hypothetical protein